MDFQGAIFDLDGVLTDTSRFHYLCWNRLAKKYNLHFDECINEKFKGVSRMDCVKMLFCEENNVDILQQRADLKNEYYIEMVKQMNPDDLFPGTKRLLMDLRQRGVKTAIGSASKNTMLVIDRLQISALFDGIADGNDVENSKPAPDVFIAAADKIKVPYHQCIVFEDSQAGVQAALAAGMTVVGVGESDNLKGARIWVDAVADLTLEQLKEI